VLRIITEEVILPMGLLHASFTALGQPPLEMHAPGMDLGVGFVQGMVRVTMVMAVVAGAYHPGQCLPLNEEHATGYAGAVQHLLRPLPVVLREGHARSMGGGLHAKPEKHYEKG
jgi:hypothetical protein